MTTTLRIFAAVLMTTFLTIIANAQTGTPYQDISDPYATDGVRSATTMAPGEEVIDPSAGANSDQRDPGVAGADGKALGPQTPMNCQAPDDEE